MGDRPVDVVAFCLQELPSLYAEALQAAQRRADAGDQRTAARLADARSTRTTTRVRLEGDAPREVYLIVERGELRVHRDSADAQNAGTAPPLTYAIALPRAAAERGIDIYRGGFVDVAGGGERLSAFATPRALQLFGMYKFAFHVVVRGVPELGELTVAVGLGRDLPAAPEFTLTVHYADLARAREAETPPQELFASGKLVIAGDVAKAMMLAMTLTQIV